MPKCPHCDGEFDIDLNMISEEKMTVTVDFEGDCIAASEIGELLVAISNSVRETARCLGSEHTTVMLADLELKPHRFSASLIVNTRDGDPDQIRDVFTEAASNAIEEE